MYHHDGRNYEQAAEQAAEYGRQKFSGLLAEERARSTAVLQRVLEERPTDALVPANRLVVDLSGEYPRLATLAGETVGNLHHNAFQQLATKSGMPLQYAQKLIKLDEPWAKELAECFKRTGRRL